MDTWCRPTGKEKGSIFETPSDLDKCVASSKA